MAWTLTEAITTRENWWVVHDALLWMSPPAPVDAALFPDRAGGGDPMELMTFGPFSDVGMNTIYIPALMFCPVIGAKAMGSWMQKLAWDENIGT